MARFSMMVKGRTVFNMVKVLGPSFTVEDMHKLKLSKLSHWMSHIGNDSYGVTNGDSQDFITGHHVVGVNGEAVMEIECHLEEYVLICKPVGSWADKEIKLDFTYGMAER